MRVLILVHLCVAMIAVRADAQRIPTLTAELSVGAGYHTVYSGGPYYEDGTTATVWFAASGAYPLSATVAVYLQAELSPDLTLGTKLSCERSPTGGCVSQFEDRGGQGGTLGVRYSPLDRLVLGAGGGAQRSNQKWRSIVDSDAAVRLWTHVALRAGVRYERWGEAGHNVWFRPITGGLRVIW